MLNSGRPDVVASRKSRPDGHRVSTEPVAEPVRHAESRPQLSIAFSNLAPTRVRTRRRPAAAAERLVAGAFAAPSVVADPAILLADAIVRAVVGHPHDRPPGFARIDDGRERGSPQWSSSPRRPDSRGVARHARHPHHRDEAPERPSPDAYAARAHSDAGSCEPRPQAGRPAHGAVAADSEPMTASVPELELSTPGRAGLRQAS